MDRRSHVRTSQWGLWRSASVALLATGVLAAGFTGWISIPDQQGSLTRVSSFDEVPGAHTDGAASHIEVALSKNNAARQLLLELRNRTESERIALASLAIYNDLGEAMMPHEPGATDIVLPPNSNARVVPLPLVQGLPPGYYYAEVLVSSANSEGDEALDEQVDSTIYFAVTDTVVEVLEAEQWMLESRILEGQAIADLELPPPEIPEGAEQ